MATVILAYPWGGFAPDSTLTIGTQITADQANALVGDGEARYGTGGPPISVAPTEPAWTAGTQYAVGQVVVSPTGTGTRCLVAHTSGTYATDLAAGKWKDTAGAYASVSQDGNLAVTVPAQAGASNGWTLGARPYATAFAAPTFRSAAANQPTAIDVSPNGTATYSWIDCCNADDIGVSNPALSTCRSGIFGNVAVFSATAFAGAATLPTTEFQVPTENVNGTTTPALRMLPSPSGHVTADGGTLATDAPVIVGVHGGSVVLGSGWKLATAATSGFIYLPPMAGKPTGVPILTYGSAVPAVVDTTHSVFWFYTGGAWKGASLAALDTAPVAVTYKNSWADQGGGQAPATYWKDSTGTVHVQGCSAHSGTSATVAFTLPAGYRLSTTMLFPAVGASVAYAAVQMSSTGDVQFFGAGAAATAYCAFSFSFLPDS